MDIFGTIGPACLEAGTIQKMFEYGMNGMRLNLSHTSLEEAAGMIRAFHKGARMAGISHPLLIIDMQGPEMRIGKLKRDLILEEGETIGLGDQIPVPDPVLACLKEGQQILLDDGKILLEVLEADGPYGPHPCRVLRGGILTSKKSIAVSGEKNTAPVLTDQDMNNLRSARDYGVTGIMQPFVRSRKDLLSVRSAMEETGCPDLKLYAKIENLEGVRCLPDFMELADEIVIARGDLGNSMPLWRLPAVQKQLSDYCTKKDKPFMVVTQMLASMEESPVPTRAEVSDIFHAVLDGAGSLMVTGETATGCYPEEVIRYLASTAMEAEKYIKKKDLLFN